ncbi:MAG: transposase, partial [Deltaproteobacteria bacterium]|nr:transposase [Deltaproteobacteria bacterium]
HAHMIIHAIKGDDLPRFLHDLCWRFAFEYNKLEKRKGHFFQNRYRASMIESDEQALTCQRYVYRNQLKAGMVKQIKDTRWSSYHHYAYGEKNDLVTPLYVFDLHGKNKEDRQLNFRVFVKTMMPHEEALWRAKLKHPFLKTTKQIVKNYLSITDES